MLDTVSQIIFPPDNSAQIAKSNATRTFEADQKLFRVGQKDTHYDRNSFRGRWLLRYPVVRHNIPPIGNQG